ncbi:MAG: glycosyltransferase family 4 protein [Polyangiaceae bacterium]|nr:glycosyltransferase family 4 protein [Polyangiaceae bacterium]
MATAFLDLTVLATDTRVRGIGRYLAELATGLERAARSGPELALGFLERVDFTGHATWSSDARASIARVTAAPAIPSLRWSWNERLGLGRALDRLRPALLHQGVPYPTPLGRPRCPRLVTCHDLVPLAFPAEYWRWQSGGAAGRRWLDTRRYRSADHLIAISRATADDLMTLLGIEARRISVVHNGIDLQQWNADPGQNDAAVLARHGLERGSYLAYAGDADWRKNRDGMLAALALARATGPGKALGLVWAGSLSADKRTRLLEQARVEGVGRAVVLTGFVPDDDLRALYRNALGLLFVSRAEGFGFPVVEGMACGCPVITSNRSSMAELAEGAALLVDPERPAEIARAIVRLCESKALRHELSQAGRARAATFGLERQAAGTLAVYQALIAGRTP